MGPFPFLTLREQYPFPICSSLHSSQIPEKGFDPYPASEAPPAGGLLARGADTKKSPSIGDVFCICSELGMMFERRLLGRREN